MMENTRKLPQLQLSQVIPEDIAFKLNDHADSIPFFKKFVKEGKKEQIRKQFESVARGLMSTKKITYKGNQKFEMEEILFADSSSISKKKNKGARKSKDHSANRRVLTC